MSRTVDVRATSFLEVATAKIGLRRAIGLMVFVQEWADIRARLNRDLLMAEYVRESGANRSTAYRHLADFRRVFDAKPAATPNDVLQLLEAVPATPAKPNFRIVPA
jgi:hypothetical protein